MVTGRSEALVCTHRDDFFIRLILGLLFKISQMYYNNKHYVWCAPAFNARGNPPSSNPLEIYSGLKKDIAGLDLHSAKIRQNKLGMLKGARLKREAGVITASQEADIKSIVKAAEIQEFRPLIYVISLDLTKPMLEYVEIKHKANKFSQEVIIRELPGEYFDAIEI